MKETKITAMQKRIDGLGRMVIPMEIRTLLGIRTNDVLTVSTDGENVIIRLKTPKCPLCGGKLDEGHSLCSTCVEMIKATE